MAEGAAKWRIGPLTAYVDVAEIRRWHRTARAGDKTFYAIGPAKSRGNGTVALVEALVQAKTARIWKEPDGRGNRYMICKIANDSISPGATGGKGAAGSGDSPVAPTYPPASPEGRVLAVLRQHPAGAPRLSLAQIADAADLPNRFYARRVLERLRACGVTV